MAEFSAPGSWAPASDFYAKFLILTCFLPNFRLLYLLFAGFDLLWSKNGEQCPFFADCGGSCGSRKLGACRGLLYESPEPPPRLFLSENVTFSEFSEPTVEKAVGFPGPSFVDVGISRRYAFCFHQHCAPRRGFFCRLNRPRYSYGAIRTSERKER